MEIQNEAQDEEEGGWANWLMLLALFAYYRVFALLYSADGRRREHRADRMSAEICGPQNVRNALMKTHLTNYLPELTLEELFNEYCTSERDIKNIYQEHRNRWAQVPPARRQQAENEMFLEPPSVWSSHPCLSRRMRALAKVTAKEWVVDKPATRLFSRWAHWEQLITEKLITWGRAKFEEHINTLDRELRAGPDLERQAAMGIYLSS
jgi:hypothetical protein